MKNGKKMSRHFNDHVRCYPQQCVYSRGVATLLSSICLFLFFQQTQIFAEMDASLYEKILGRSKEKAETSSSKKNTQMLPEMSMQAGYGIWSGSVVRGGSSYSLTSIESWQFGTGVYLNNLIHEATSTVIYDFDVGLFLSYRTKAASGIQVTSADLEQLKAPSLEVKRKQSTYNTVVGDFKFRIMGDSSQDFQLAFVLRGEKNLQKFDFRDKNNEKDYYAESFVNWGTGVDLSLYLLPFLGINGYAVYLRELNYYFKGSSPKFIGYEAFGRAFIDMFNVQLYYQQGYRTEIFSSQALSFQRKQMVCQQGGLVIYYYF